MKTELDVDALLAETWLTVTQLRYDSQMSVDKALYQQCCQQIEQVREALENADYTAANIAHISYAQCALLDETALGRQPKEGKMDDGLQMWREAPLQARYFDSLDAGKALWARLAQILAEPAPLAAVLTCYQRVFALGFEGVYSLKGVDQRQREILLNALNNQVTLSDPALPLLLSSLGKRRYAWLSSYWFWIFLSVMICGLLGWGGQRWLHGVLSRVLG